MVYLHRLKKEGLIKTEGAKNNRKYIPANPIIENLKNTGIRREKLIDYVIDKSKKPYIREALEFIDKSKIPHIKEALEEVLKDA